MRACVAVLYSCAALVCAPGAACVTVHYTEPELPPSDIQRPLPAITIKCSTSDVIIVSAPVVRDALYFLTRPDGRTGRLNITRPTYTVDSQNPFNNEYDSIIIKHESIFKTIVPTNNYKVFDLLPDGYGDVTQFESQTKDLNSNDFIIGPLIEEDHGNWILSLYHKEPDDMWIEMYQVITVEISEYVPPRPRSPVYNVGDTFEFSFAYSIPYLESCELHAPKSTFDRFYERNTDVDMSRCGYVIKNVTTEDRGMWSITGVGRVVYGTQVFLDVKDKTLNKTLTELIGL